MEQRHRLAIHTACSALSWRTQQDCQRAHSNCAPTSHPSSQVACLFDILDCRDEGFVKLPHLLVGLSALCHGDDEETVRFCFGVRQDDAREAWRVVRRARWVAWVQACEMSRLCTAAAMHACVCVSR